MKLTKLVFLSSIIPLFATAQGKQLYECDNEYGQGCVAVEGTSSPIFAKGTTGTVLGYDERQNLVPLKVTDLIPAPNNARFNQDGSTVFSNGLISNAIKTNDKYIIYFTETLPDTNYSVDFQPIISSGWLDTVIRGIYVDRVEIAFVNANTGSARFPSGGFTIDITR
ncbi:hypothetical protein J8M20_14045 [Pseudoalteromonas luteoviolacea]|uniref:hypothetical protein n=1 Tax=Pseudoalteromonas luteoviolacea TaxID=43657 RepID=UPI001B38F930|nr:hypothetical protein [Pseudoalteromonas luteoviolacea]MBQ4812475.1 hypothetical protein [Pseudoalteromonas luteoviolacea]